MLMLPLLILKSPRLVITRKEMEPKVLWRIASPLCYPPVDSEDKGPVKKRKHTEDLTSSGTSNPTDVS
jgi:hypothetical protein